MVADKGLTLPAVEAASPAPPDILPLVTITKTELLVGHDHIADVLPGPLGFAAEIKRMQQRSALQVLPLDAALRPLHPPGTAENRVRILVDASTPYRSALEAFFTASQAGFTSFAFVVKSKGGERAVHANTPSRAEWDAAHTPGAPQPVSFVLDTNGASLSVGTVKIGAGCSKGASGVAVPASGGKLDAAQIAACAARVPGMSPLWAGISVANVTAAPEIDMQTVLTIVNGIESTFPTVHFGMMSSG
jgi:hypothetical protein